MVKGIRKVILEEYSKVVLNLTNTHKTPNIITHESFVLIPE